MLLYYQSRTSGVSPGDVTWLNLAIRRTDRSQAICVAPARPILIALRWIGISTGFDRIVEEHIENTSSLSVYEDFLWRHLHQEILIDNQLCRSHQNLLRLVIVRYFRHIREFGVPIAFFTHMHSVLEQMFDKDFRVIMPRLGRVTIQIGGEFGRLLFCHNFDNLKVCRMLCNRLSEVNLDMKLSDSETVTPCGFRSLVRYLLEVTDLETVWNVILEDCTTNGQGYHGPADFSQFRNQVFISYVRTLLDLGVVINRLTLLDKHKISPYMMVMSLNKRRSLYMYPEFKRCRELFVCYDIGLVAPIFAHENDRFALLQVFEVDESHVLYKRDLLEYLSNAPNLREIRVVVPATWSRRVRTCSIGCFKSPDFACFRPDGWCAVHTRLPSIKFTLVGIDLDTNCDQRSSNLRHVTI
ncbi:hypothetical protein RB195_018802 [Necator americanus]|uniref:Uncharacterized protein n=1 Tax=Necator americanus TaxID=51031 RepID=A0ABR1CE34_NECAM